MSGAKTGSTAESSGALAGIRVLDMSRVLAGPFATQILADLGAEVIKVEDPARGDETRAWGPPFAGSESAYFLSVNRGKRSVAVNLKTEAGRQIVRELAGVSDVLIENLKPGDMARYGLDYETLSVENPRLVYCSITGFGQSGPMSRLPGYDFAVQAMCGIMSVTGAPGGPPTKVGVAWVDILCGLFAAVAIQAALRARERSGRGQYIDLSLWDAGVAAMANLAQAYLVSGKNPRRLGNAHAQIVPYQLFDTADGHLVVAVGNDAQFARFCQCLGRPEWSADPRFATNPARVRHRDELIPLVAGILRGKPTAKWLDLLARAQVPAAPVWELSDVFESDLAAHRGMRWSVEHPAAGTVDLVGSPLQHMSATPAQSQGPPPTLGQHTEEVLCGLLGYTPEQVRALAQAGAIGIGKEHAA
ncbi:MAG: CoA transferase [Firmicutes bacterium]|nr:CoA transferase [Bacillota bacterium]